MFNKDVEIAKRDRYKADAKAILADETRDYTPDDAKKVDELMAKVDEINAKLDAMSKMEDEEVAEEKVAEERSFRNAPAVLRSKGRKSTDNVHEHAAKERYSVTRAALDFVERGQLTGIEKEVDQELRRHSACNGSFKMPADFSKLNIRADQTLTTGVGAIPIYWDSFIEYLYPQLIGPQLGFTYLSGLAGVTKLPRQSGVPTVSAVAEQGSATASNTTLDNVVLTPRTMTANVNISRKFMMQSVVAADQYIMSAGSKQIAVQADQWCITGSGASNQPFGLLNNAGFTQVQVAAANAPAYADILALEQKVWESNAGFGNLKYLTSPYGFNKLSQTAKIGTTFPNFILENGEINGTPVIRSSQVPKTLTYTGVSNLTALIYGNWSELVFATFGQGVDVISDPYTGSAAGDVRITFLLDADTNLLQNGAFSAIPNIA